jgi:hypothetical protein
VVINIFIVPYYPKKTIIYNEHFGFFALQKQIKTTKWN